MWIAALNGLFKLSDTNNSTDKPWLTLKKYSMLFQVLYYLEYIVWFKKDKNV